MERGDLNNCQTQKSLVKHPYTKNSLLKATLNSYKLRTVQFVVLINTKYVFNKNDEKKQNMLLLITLFTILLYQPMGRTTF